MNGIWTRTQIHHCCSSSNFLADLNIKIDQTDASADEWKPNPKTNCSVLTTLSSSLVTTRFKKEPPSMTLQSGSFADLTTNGFNRTTRTNGGRNVMRLFFVDLTQPRFQCDCRYGHTVGVRVRERPRSEHRESTRCLLPGPEWPWVTMWDCALR